MKRLIVLAVLSLMAVFLMTTLAAGKTGTTKTATSSKVTPKRDKKSPYKFKTRGRVKYPSSFCAPNAPASNCVPLTCPPGATDPAYCTKPTAAQLCSGKVRISFKGARTSITKRVNLRSNCTYRKTTTIRRKGRLKVRVRFLGNSRLAASSASTKRVRAG